MSTTTQDKTLMMYSRICQARNAETMRVADLIEQAMYEAKTDDVRDALVALAIKVLKP